MERRILLLSMLAAVFWAASSPTLCAQATARLVPTAAELPGFKITRAAEYYNAGNLWKYIDGGAPGYLAYGFKEVAAFAVTHPAGQLEFTVDIYDMGDALNAFGIYSTERSPEGTAIDTGSQGYRTENALFFWQDRYYVKIVGDTPAPPMAATSMKLAAIVSRKLPPRGAPPRLFSVFPEEGRIRGSERFLAHDVLGQQFLHNGYIVEYAKKDAKYRLFLIRAGDARQAQRGFRQYRDFVETNGSIAARPQQLGEEAFLGKASAYGGVVVARQGRYMAGVLGLDDADAARAIVLVMLSKLAGGRED